MNDHRLRCPHCELVQFAGVRCRRCENLLPQPITNTVTVFVSAAFGDKLPTMDELEQMLIAEAMRRTGGDVIEAARLIGMGKTTVYRKLKCLGSGDGRAA